jgi:hypothetical protein
MPDETTILSLPLILPAQAQKHVTHNEALAQLDLIVQLTVIDRVQTTAPALPAVGDRHIVAAGATGPWVGQSGRIALYTTTGWQFTQALPGWRAHVPRARRRSLTGCPGRRCRMASWRCRSLASRPARTR